MTLHFLPIRTKCSETTCPLDGSALLSSSFSLDHSISLKTEVTDQIQSPRSPSFHTIKIILVLFTEIGLSHNSDPNKEVDLTQFEGLYEIFMVCKPFQKESRF